MNINYQFAHIIVVCISGALVSAKALLALVPLTFRFLLTTVPPSYALSYIFFMQRNIQRLKVPFNFGCLLRTHDLTTLVPLVFVNYVCCIVCLGATPGCTVQAYFIGPAFHHYKYFGCYLPIVQTNKNWYRQSLHDAKMNTNSRIKSRQLYLCINSGIHCASK